MSSEETLQRLASFGATSEIPKEDATAKVNLEAEIRLSGARVWLVHLDHKVADEHMFQRDDLYWIDLCLTPRRPNARARYVDLWSPHRFNAMGSIIALPPRFKLHLKNEGGKHISLICALDAKLVDRWFSSDFEWTDRRLEACLNISNSTIRSLLLNLSHEMRHPGVGSRELSEAIIQMLPIELARNLIAMDEPTEYGGLSAWRLRAIDRRIGQPGKLPALSELASECRISVRQLTRGFRTSRGCSIGDYLAQQRIDAAKRRLATDESIKSIAASTGFSSQSTFTYTFRRSTGVTPHEYRRRVLRAIKEDSPAK